MLDEGNFQGFKRAEVHKDRLRKVIADAMTVADGLNASASTADLRKTDERVASDKFRVMVVGEFNRGKSTLINAILGTDVLPAYARPATAVMTELRWSEQPTAVLYPADGGAPVDVAVTELTKHITIPRGVEQGSAETSRWKLAKVGWPLEILREGVLLIDSPGLNEHPARQEVTLQYLSRADAIVFVQDCQHAVAMAEVSFMENYLDAYDVFFVFNKINFIPPGEVDEVREELIFRVREHRDQERKDRYFFVNALAALEARVSGDDAAWRASQVAGFVADLNSFLVTDRHRAKLIGPARETGKEIRLLRHAIPVERALLDQSEADLRQRYQDAQAPLKRLKDMAKQIRQKLDADQRNVQQIARGEVSNRLLRMSSEMPDIIANVTPESKLMLRPWRTKESAETYAKELSDLASAEAVSRLTSWQRGEFKSRLEPELTSIAGDADTLIKEFRQALAKVREDLTGLQLEAGDTLAGIDSDRALSDADIGLTESFGGLAVGHIMGQIAAMYGVLTIWAFTPFGLISLIVGVLLANAAVLGFAQERMAKKVRAEISTALAEKVRAEASGNADKSAAEIGAVLASAVDELMSRVDNELKQLRIQVEGTLKMLSQGEDAVRQRRVQLSEWGTALEKAADEIEDLITDVALT